MQMRKTNAHEWVINDATKTSYICGEWYAHMVRTNHLSFQFWETVVGSQVASSASRDNAASLRVRPMYLQVAGNAFISRVEEAERKTVRKFYATL